MEYFKAKNSTICLKQIYLLKGKSFFLLPHNLFSIRWSKAKELFFLYFWSLHNDGLRAQWHEGDLKRCQVL